MDTTNESQKRILVTLDEDAPLPRALSTRSAALGWSVDVAPRFRSLLKGGGYDLVVSGKLDALLFARRASPTSTRVLVPPLGGLCGTGARLAHHLLAHDAGVDELAMVVDCASGGLGLLDVPLPQGSGALPPMPGDVQRLMAVLDDPGATVQQVLEVTQSDPALVAKILQLANSSYFQLARRVSSLKHAITLLGMNTIRVAALAGRCFEAVEGVPPSEITRVREHGLRAMRLVRELAGGHAEEAVTAALLVDIGQLLLLGADPEYPRLRRQAQLEGQPLATLERERYGATHAQLGARLLHEWGLPDAVVHAIAFSHTPFPLPAHKHEPRAWLFIASALVDGADGGTFPLDPSWVEQTELSDVLLEGASFLEDLTVLT